MHQISAKTDSLDVFDQICPKRAFQFRRGKIALVRPPMVVTFSARGPTEKQYLNVSSSSIHRDNNILKLPDLCLRLACFYSLPFLVRA